MKNFITTYLMNTLGSFDCNKSKRSWYIKNNFESEYDKIFNLTDFLDSTYNFSARIYCILNDISKDDILCNHCRENIAAYINSSKGFRDYCSSKCSANSKDTKEKYKNTNLEKYGVEFSTQAEVVKDKIEATLMKNYGVSVPMKSSIIKDRVEATNLERYGTTYGFGCDIVKEKIAITNTEKYGSPFSTNNIDAEKFLSDKSWLEEQFLTKNTKMIASEVECSTSFVNVWARTHEITNRAKLYSEEQEIYDFLLECGCETIHKNNYGIIGNPSGTGRRQLDLYIPEYNLAIEVNGLYWHSNNKTRHLEKLKLCRDHDIKLLQFWDYQWNDQTDICKSIISSNLRLNEKLSARKCKIVELSSNEYKRFLNNNHMQGEVGSSIKYGLIYNTELVSVIGFSKSRYDKTYDWELMRYVNKLNTNIVGGFSRLLTHFRKNNSGSIISYCDLMLFDGAMYSLAGFEHKRDSIPGYFYTKGSSMLKREQMQKHKLSEILDSYVPELTADENIANSGWNKIWNCGNGVWVLN